MHYALSSVDATADSYLHHEAWPVPYGKREAEHFAALVFLWATAGAMAQAPNGDPPDAYVLARLLGLRVCASAVWCKVDEVRVMESMADDEMFDAFTPPRRMGLGQWLRVEDERLLICRRGDVPVPAPEARPRSVIYAPRGAHSAKPEKAWTQVIEPIARSSMPGVVGVEFNARRRRRGWSAVGRLDGEDRPVRYERAPADERGEGT